MTLVARFEMRADSARKAITNKDYFSESEFRASEKTFQVAIPKSTICSFWQCLQRYVRISSPDIVLLSIKTISPPHSGHFVKGASDKGSRRYLSVIQEGNFMRNSPDARLPYYLSLDEHNRHIKLAGLAVISASGTSRTNDPRARMPAIGGNGALATRRRDAAAVRAQGSARRQRHPCRLGHFAAEADMQ